jgi:hypothetical protein
MYAIANKIAILRRPFAVCVFFVDHYSFVEKPKKIKAKGLRDLGWDGEYIDYDKLC